VKNDHTKESCWLCLRQHQFMTAKCAADLMGLTPNAIYNNPGRHFKVIKNQGTFYLRSQVEMHFQIVVANGECKGECKSVFEDVDKAIRLTTQKDRV
jgi:hypothetical protein